MKNRADALLTRVKHADTLRRRAQTILGSPRAGLTLIEVLVALAISLLMMAAVLTVFANVTGSITRRRATIEMAGAVRNVRETLSRDLEGATCPAVPWQRPESNHGYIEIIEGPQNDYYPSIWLYDSSDADMGAPDGLLELSPPGTTPGIDLALSTLPGSNLREPNTPQDEEGRGLALGQSEVLDDSFPTDGRALGDADDILMLTVRNENQPFVGRVPPVNAAVNAFGAWSFQEIEAPLAEVVWFSLENPPERDDARTFAFGEPGFRTIYRRVLLIDPSLNYRFQVGAKTTGPGVVRVLPNNIDRNDLGDWSQALAALVAFQERYDLSVRLEWDPLLGSDGRWTIRANSLADLTKRENRFEHHGLVPLPLAGAAVSRYFPFPVVSAGQYSNNGVVVFATDPDLVAPASPAEFQAVVAPNGLGGQMVAAYESTSPDTTSDLLEADRRYPTRPFAYVLEQGNLAATARAVTNEDGSVVYVTRGLAPLGGTRRGEDIMLTSALAFDLRVYDPGAPLYSLYPGGDTDIRADQVIEPSDPAWSVAYQTDVSAGGVGFVNVNSANPPVSSSFPFRFERQGTYVDMGYRATFVDPPNPGNLRDQFVTLTLSPWLAATGTTLRAPLFADPSQLPAASGNVSDALLANNRFQAPGYSVYDTWSWSYENNGLDEDADDVVDESTNGFEDQEVYYAPGATNATTVVRNGPDDPGERETRPPYDTALRGLQVKLRVYEPDSLQVLETTVRESFVPE